MGGDAGVREPYCDICGVVEDLHNKMYCNLLNKQLRDRILTQLKACKYQEALERIRDCDFVITLPDRMDAVRQIAREALE